MKTKAYNMKSKPKLIQPLGSRLLLSRAKPEEVSIGGIIIPTVAQQIPNEGTVIALGLGNVDGSDTQYNFTVKVGDVVLYNEFSASKVTHDGMEYLMLEERDIFAIIPK